MGRSFKYGSSMTMERMTNASKKDKSNKVRKKAVLKDAKERTDELRTK